MGVDEDSVHADSPAELAGVLADAKATAVASDLGSGFVIGCDSLLEFDGKAHGKPQSQEEAAERWRLMSGHPGTLHTGHCVVDASTGRSVSAICSTIVRFGRPSEAEILAYVASGEPMHVAGAFTIDGRGGWFIEGIEGDHGNVLGLSLSILNQLLRDLDVDVTSLWE